VRALLAVDEHLLHLRRLRQLQQQRLLAAAARLDGEA
jgi:hypothetical protein